MAIHDKYNIPLYYDHSVQRLYESVLKELKPYSDLCYFIYAGFSSGDTDIRSRTDDNILAQITEAYNNGARNIIFDCVGEGLANDYLVKLNRVAGIAKQALYNVKMFYLTSAIDGEEAYKRFCKEDAIPAHLEIIACHYFEHIVKQYPVFRTEYNTPANPRKYTCLNRVIRPHRILLLEKLLSENLVTDCFYSFCDTEDEDCGLSAVYAYGADRFPNIIKNIDVVKTLRLNFDKNRTNPADIRLEDLHLFTDSYFSVIPETGYFDPMKTWTKYAPFINRCCFFSEKIYKPISMLHPFVIVSSPNSLKFLRERGYRTFTPFIDETYDTIEDDEERMDAIVAEIKRLCSQTDEQWVEWCAHIKPIVEYNLQHFLALDDYLVNKDLIGKLARI